MSDNVRVVTSSGTIAVATNDISSVHYQRMKLTHGGAGTATDTSALAPLPVTVTAGTTVISGTPAVTAAVTGGTIVVQDGGSSISVDDNGSSLTVDGSVSVSSLPALPAGTNNIGDVDVLSLPALPAGSNAIGRVDVGSALPAGTNAIGKLAANSGVDIGDVDVTSLPAIPAGSNTIGNVGVIGRTTGGLSMFRSVDLDETEEDVKTSAGQLFGWYLYNNTSSVLFVKLYNAAAASVTVGTTTPVLTIPVPANSGANALFDIGIAFSTAISAAATTGVADSDTGAPAANALIANFFYA